MRWLYVSRQNNRSGFHILEHLLQEGIHIPTAILLPRASKPNLLGNATQAQEDMERYSIDVAFYGCRPLRFHKSIQKLSENAGIDVTARTTIKNDETYEWIRSLSLDLIVLGGGWPELLPKRIIDIPRLGTINTHPSLLPEFRGTDVHRWQVYHGIQYSGTTIHYVDEHFDTGAILGQAVVEVHPDDVPQELAENAAIVAGPLMSDVLNQIFQADPKRLQGNPQTARGEFSRYFSRWRWEDRDFLQINWKRPATDLSRFIRACTQETYRYNGPFFRVRGYEYIIRLADVTCHDGRGYPGEVIRIDDDVIVRCEESEVALRLMQIQPIRSGDWATCSHSERAVIAGVLFCRDGISVGDNLIKLSAQEDVVNE